MLIVHFLEKRKVLHETLHSVIHCVTLCHVIVSSVSSVVCFMCDPGAPGEIHQVCLRNQQHRPAAHGAGEQDGERDDRLRPLGRGHHCGVEGRAERVVGRPPGADGDSQTDAGGIAPAAQVLHRLQRGTVRQTAACRSGAPCSACPQR